MQPVATIIRSNSGRFASLMELYESNYMLVRLLAPALRTMQTDSQATPDGTSGPNQGPDQCPTQCPTQCPDQSVEPPASRWKFVSVVPGCLDLELGSIEHEKYTTTFNLTYRFLSDERSPREPDLTVRIYHDARTCEVMSGLLQGTRHGPLRTRDLDEGYRLNRFLQKWVGYCLRQGHSFKAGHSIRMPDSEALLEDGAGAKAAAQPETVFTR